MTGISRPAESGRSGAPLRRAAPSARAYSLAAAGPIGVAGGQFLLSLLVLMNLDARDFGNFSLLMALFFLSLGIWGALFCAPLPALLKETSGARRRALIRTLLSANLVATLGAGLAAAAAAAALGQDLLPALLFGSYVAMMLLRWFSRAFAYAFRARARTAVSDFVYSGVLVAGAAGLHLLDAVSLPAAFALLLLAAGAGLAAFGPAHLLGQMNRVSWPAALGYAPIWKRRSSWSLTGVMTTEATTNAQAYLVAWVISTAAYAPIAACALLVRPIVLVCNALGEFERPRLARLAIRSGARLSLPALARILARFLASLVTVWLGNAVLAAGLLILAPRLLFPAEYDLQTLVTGTALFLLQALVRAFGTPVNTLLQARGEFRALAQASLVSSAVSVSAVLILLAAAPPIWAIGGVVLGEALFTAILWRVAPKALVR